MLIDATHPEQTRVAVVDSHKLLEYDFESISRKQLKGNIYLAKVIRIEPSLQAAFVEYGGNRHGFLAFSEIHTDYYRIPIADRQALEREFSQQMDGPVPEFQDSGDFNTEGVEDNLNVPFGDEEIIEDQISSSVLPPAVSLAPTAGSGPMLNPFGEEQEGHGEEDIHEEEPSQHSEMLEGLLPPADEAVHAAEGAEETRDTPVETVGGDEVESAQDHRRRRFIRRYKIQEVIKRGQIMLVQVVKEERGNKGAALTTYLSLAGRYCVLMPNTDKGGGISRKITNMHDRRRMKELLDELEVPGGMAVILRTAGIERSKIEVRRDLEYLLRLWDSIREATLKSIAPSLVYEEADLIKRAIRDLYAPDIDNILVEGDDGYQKARDFMRMLMPSHARRVHHYRDEIIPLFFRYQVENQINSLHTPTVQLRSGGYLVINQAEALVAIDVNSGRATRERHIEETALRTNLEAAEEAARQIRLRDLAGLIVIDFIDMEDGRNNSSVERRLKESMRHDRARLQIGRISHFGLLELSRQRLRPSLLDLNFEKCPHCHGTGNIRLVESAALLALHTMEEEGMRQNASEIVISVPSNIALYILNHKRQTVEGIEKRYGLVVNIRTKEDVIPPEFPVERIRAKKASEQLPISQMINEQQIFADTDRDMGLGGEELEQVGSMTREPSAARSGDEEGGEDEAMPLDNSGSAFSDVYGGEARQGYGGDRGGEAGQDDRRRRRRGRRGGRRRSGSGSGGSRFEGRENRGEGRSENRGENREGSFQPRTRDSNREGVREDGLEAPRDNWGNGEGNLPPREPRAPREPRENGGGFENRENREPREPRERRDNRERRGDQRQRRPAANDGYRERRPYNRPQEAPMPAVPASIFELDTTPREASYVPPPPAPAYAPPPPRHEQTASYASERPREMRQESPPSDNHPVNIPPDKKKSGWWQKLTGSSS
jgi:ribonuclease E